MRILILLIFIMGFLHASAQDNIFLKDSSIVIGKVSEISNKKIKYKTADNPDGPVYIIKKSKVARIRYGNGKEELFDSSKDTNTDFMEDKMARHCVYFELAGNGINGVSLNFDYTFYRTATIGLSGRF
jgi:hypothetical protein